ncbi:MAG: ribosome biogenesis GTPase Der [Lentisphaerae bacterium]|nr:ribosome biogenesis GTPase Der [Lentisphaerota bacterium]
MTTSESLPMVAIVGRPNVGKSALFNRIVGRRISIVHEESGVTRDRIAAAAAHAGRPFTLVDTGGLGIGRRETRHVGVFDGLIRDQVAAIVDEAAVLIWVVDCQTGVTPQDEEVAALLRAAGRPVVVAANKADNEALASAAATEFSRLGFPVICPTSCTHTRGRAELLDLVVERLPRATDDRGAGAAAAAPEALKLAVVGRPNVGKSSLVNRLFGGERVIVSEVAGTTRDAVDVPVTLHTGGVELPLVLIDTAGLRRRRQISTVVDFFSMARTQEAIRRSDAVLLVLDATALATAQDSAIARLVADARKPCIIVVNKWDLAEAEGVSRKAIIEQVYERLSFMRHAPMQLISALTGDHVTTILGAVVHLREQMKVTVPTSVLNQFLQDLVARTPPPAATNRRFKIFYGTMLGNPPPRFVLFANDKAACPPRYLQFIENQIREAFFPQTGLPIIIEVRQRADPSEGTGARRAAAGVQRQRSAAKKAIARHHERKKGWRKRP